MVGFWVGEGDRVKGVEYVGEGFVVGDKGMGAGNEDVRELGVLLEIGDEGGEFFVGGLFGMELLKLKVEGFGLEMVDRVGGRGKWGGGCGDGMGDKNG